ncbi:hypothetical protein HGRIS_012464 [Hohenbuehelia grisea]|uniref:Pterin-binding domain-containing protein n=1 Tax=Hohenbuehelia grisea TaxID=104357 RepID=A0ABR3ISD0_9AGAR
MSLHQSPLPCPQPHQQMSKYLGRSLIILIYFLSTHLAPNGCMLIVVTLLAISLCIPTHDALPGNGYQNREKDVHTAALALGSNLGDSFHNIELALRLLEAPMTILDRDALQIPDACVDVIDTSFMYKTKPMYVEEQPAFINCACIVETNLQPMPLLRLLKAIENLVGRVPSIRNGPRAVDLDIILYDNMVIDTRSQHQRADLNNLEGHLVVPHPRLQEREFVLRPLFDMIPDYVHPKLGKTICSLLEALPETDPTMQSVVPFPLVSEEAVVDQKASAARALPTLTHWAYFQNASSTSHQTRLARKTHIMATLNVTPDSFSDGSAHTQLDAALKYVRNAIASGASIVDIGGYSTRPHAAFVSVEEEIQRVVPVIKAIRQQDNPAVRNVLISVDTFRPEVAQAAIYAGANCINDVHAFTGPNSYPSCDDAHARSCMAAMKKLARQTSVPVILMHSRGDAGQNKDYGNYAYAQGSATGGPGVEGVRVELGRKVDEIVKGKGGVRRWLVVVDPGVGFSKTLEVNLEVLRDASLLTVDVCIGTGGRRRNPLRGYPILIGASKKSFLGVILGQGDSSRETAASERNWATAATVACAVQQGALITRVHDTQEMHDVVKVAQAIWK